MNTALNTEEWLQRLATALRGLRLRQNLGQAEVAARAGVGRTAIQNLESGRGTLSTLVRVVRALGREDWLQALDATPSINPLHIVRHKQRQRASRKPDDQAPR